MSRSDDLGANLAALRERIGRACAAASRDPDEITVVAVTKTFPVSDLRLLVELGVTDVGENRDQEAKVKHEACADLALRWHFVGRLQRNKARSVANYADVVHSVDRLSLTGALSEAAQAAGREIVALVQVSLDEQGGGERGGVPADLAPELADAVASAPSLLLGGVMAVAPLGGDADLAYARLAEVGRRLRRDHPDAAIVSAGMSGDLEAAIHHGATHVRIGTALLGHRASPVG